MVNTSAPSCSLQPQDQSLQQPPPAQVQEEQIPNSLVAMAGTPCAKGIAGVKQAAGFEDDVPKALANLAADSASSMHPPAVCTTSTVQTSISSQPTPCTASAGIQDMGKAELVSGMRHRKADADSRGSSIDTAPSATAAPTSKDSLSSHPPSPAAASTKEAAANDGKVPVKEKKQNKIASIGSSLLATIREKSGSAGLTKNE
jgi:hypothetical protein